MAGENGGKPRLCSVFPPHTHEEWLAKVDQDIGLPSRQDLTWTTGEGIDVFPLFERRDLEGLAHMAPGISRVLREKRSWCIRQLIQAADPGRAAQLAAQALAAGAHELMIRFDRLVRHGADPGTLQDSEADRDLYLFEAGQDGCAAYNSTDLARALEHVDLAEVPLAIEAGAASLGVLGMLLHIADDRGTARNGLRIDLGLDPISELVAGETPGRSAKALLDEGVAAAVFAMPWPGIRPLCVHGSTFHRVGATAADEVGCSMAAAIEYIRALVAAGLDVDAATDSVTLRVQVDTDIVFETARLRATRLLWAKIVQAFGGRTHAVSLHVESSQRSLASEDVHTNLLRSTLQAVTASFAGFDSLTLAPYAQRPDEDDSLRQTLARSQQVLLREESHLHKVRDACGGSYAIEKLTDELARRAWSVVQEIEAGGGLFATLDTNLLQNRINASAERRKEDIQTRRRSMVGVNRYVEPGSTAEVDPIGHAPIVAAHLEYLRGRNGSVEAANLIQPDSLETLVHAAKSGCTAGEITKALRGGEFTALRHSFHAFSSDGSSFEELRAMVACQGVRVVPVLAGAEELREKHHAFAKELFQTGGFEVLEPLDPSSDLEHHQADIVALCGEESPCEELLPRIPESSLVVAIGRELSKLAGRVHDVIEADKNAYLTLRSLFLATCDSEGSEG